MPVTRGVHRPRDVPDAFTADLATWQSILRPMTAFTGLTSARQRGWWLPPLPDDLPVFAAMISGRHAATRPGLVVTRHRAIPDSEIIDDLRVALPGETLLGCAAVLGLLDLLVLIDCALHTRAITLGELHRVAGQHRRGGPRMRRALEMADGRSESAWETLLRVMHIVCGIRVEPQYQLFDDHGLFVARGDLWLRGTTMLHEYDGGDHLKKLRQRKDLRRARGIGNAEWSRRGYTSEDVLHQASGILRDADATIGRPHDPARIRPWNELLRDSLFTPAGTARFRVRLGLPEGGRGRA